MLVGGPSGTDGHVAGTLSLELVVSLVPASCFAHLLDGAVVADSSCGEEADALEEPVGV